LKKFLSKKILILTTAVSIATAMGAVAYADSALKQISAYQNAGLQVDVNGSSVDLSSEDGIMYPIVYNGHSYVSAKAVAEALGASVKWNDATTTVEITSNGTAPANAGKAEKDNTKPSAPSPAPTAPSKTPAAPALPSASPVSSNNDGSISDAVSLGKTFNYTDLENYKPGENDTTSAHYTFSVNKATPITRDQISDLGFQRPDSDEKMDYVLLDVSLKVKDATFKKGSTGISDYRYLSQYMPAFWGAMTADGDKIIGGTNYGFEGSLSDEVHKVLSDFPTVQAGDSKSYEANGKIILPVVKGKESYLVLQKQDSNLEYNDSFIYFKLK
jgi:hypothetical protein